MLGRTYEGQNCSAARALEVVGERWSLLIIRDAMFKGVTRFGDFQQRLGVATNILKARLDAFVEAGLMERRHLSGHPKHFAYVLTDKGLDLQPVIMALTAWGDRWDAPDGPPVHYRHTACGDTVHLETRCAGCGEVHSATEVVTRPGAAGPGRGEPRSDRAI
ncbi:helix-turn-helix domain-containing protein [Kitasatospora paracochleata]|uniref:DNA-binding HxlR family transcriptional regulator n=1 Tax=Kitasatospora paracochleata TaxID=58354 RepID=A0ABT1IT43_9ACTN|nr:helix-turn-helix domain-containing protein [Kitasatospora paracochleata]MCP2308300.1 DNA-binding HxlR family transcriptional regulator [Kitasatospora paracochleata]